MWSKEWLHEQYEVKQKSMNEIAFEQKTYVNKIKRLLIKHGFHIRDFSEAQKNALASGKAIHPTKDKKRDSKTKEKISKSVADAHRRMPEKQRKQINKKLSEVWESQTEHYKKKMISLAAKGLRKSATYGSKLEKFLIYELQNAGYNVDFHAKVIPNKEKMEVDILLTKEQIAIEIDGPSHFLPIHGQERLEKRKRADKEKDGLLVSHGYYVIRVENLKKTMSYDYMRRMSEKVINQIKSYNGNKAEVVKITDE